jgi:tetratricopeptide (TPR) repeat protein
VPTPERVEFNRLSTQAAILLQTKRYSDTIAHAMKALALFPDDPRPCIQIAYAMARMKNPDAPEWARKAISKEPTNAMWWAALSDTFNIRGKWKEGLEPMKKAASMAPQNPRVQAGLGMCLLYRRKYKEAIPVLERALELDPTDARAHKHLSIAFLKTRNKKGADEHLSRALELKPDDPSIQASLGWHLRRKGRNREAEGAFREALRLEPQASGSKVGLGEPKGDKVGWQDRVLRSSVFLTWVPHRRILNYAHLVLLVILVENIVMGIPPINVWQIRLLEYVALGWTIYFILTPMLVLAIGKRRGVHFFV